VSCVEPCLSGPGGGSCADLSVNFWALELNVGRMISVLVYNQSYTAPVSGALMLTILFHIHKGGKTGWGDE
jgi:hypothetical protein